MKSPVKTASAEIDKYVKNQQARLSALIKARSKTWSALEKEISASDDGKALLAQRQTIAKQIDQFKSKGGNIDAVKAEFANLLKTEKALQTKYGKEAAGWWKKVATSAPSKAELGKAYFDFQPADGEFELFDMLGLRFHRKWPRHPPPPPPAPLDLSATTFTRQETQDHTDVFAFPGAFANPAAGRFGLFVQAAAADLVPGGVGSRALIGADFSIPAGHPVITVTADVDWNYALSCWVVLGGAACSAELVLRVEPTSGAAHESTQPLSSLVAPALWTASSDGSGSTLLSTTLTLASSAAQTLRVYAGTDGSGVVEGVAGIALVSVDGTLRRISIHAA